MTAVAKKWVSTGTEVREGVHFHCPGCDSVHGIHTGPGGWTWNGDLVRPTLSPSVLVHPIQTIDEDAQPITTPLCHSFVNDGRIQYLTDSTHHLAGQTVDLPPWEDR